MTTTVNSSHLDFKPIIPRNDSKVIKNSNYNFFVEKAKKLTPFVLAVMGGFGAAWLIMGNSFLANQRKENTITGNGLTKTLDNNSDNDDLKIKLQQHIQKINTLELQLEKKSEQFDKKEIEYKNELTECHRTSTARKVLLVVGIVLSTPLLYYTAMFFVVKSSFDKV